MATRLPSPVRRLSADGVGGAELWVKDDSLIGRLYGGNKARKLHQILPHARERGARRLVTVGPAGSHHVLATTLLGRKAGFDVTALLFPRPYDPSAVENLARAIHAGMVPHTVRAAALVPLHLPRLLRPRDYLVPAGGSGPIGASGYYRAASELAGQVDAGKLPEPDVIVVALGTGGTAAGLVAGIHACGLKSVVCAVEVAMGRRAGRALVSGLAGWVARREHLQVPWRVLGERLSVDDRFLGKGYGRDTTCSRRAREQGEKFGLELDGTYTGKAFAKALELGRFPGYDAESWPRRQVDDPIEAELLRQQRRSDRPLRVLYWHTLSGVRPRSKDLSPSASPPSAAPADANLPSSLMKQFLIR
jgi:1-aminocyclopropane-1-carboxylate deaminase/D-cysteine desulfhydrase-like pyridoxal-dependent ACC family enzyme